MLTTTIIMTVYYIREKHSQVNLFNNQAYIVISTLHLSGTDLEWSGPSVVSIKTCIMSCVYFDSRE